MTKAYCPWCAMEIDARLAVELKRESDQLRRRADAADQIADSLWSTANALQRFPREFGRLWDKDEDWDHRDERTIEDLIRSLTESMSELSEAKGDFVAANRG